MLGENEPLEEAVAHCERALEALMESPTLGLCRREIEAVTQAETEGEEEELWLSE